MTDRSDDNSRQPANANEADWPPRWAPTGLVALAEIVALAEEAVEWRADAFERDEPVPGSDAIEFLAGWRLRARDALGRYEANRRSLVTTLPIDPNDAP